MYQEHLHAQGTECCSTPLPDQLPGHAALTSTGQLKKLINIHDMTSGVSSAAKLFPQMCFEDFDCFVLGSRAVLGTQNKACKIIKHIRVLPTRGLTSPSKL
jgi:hypothetical protein